VHQKECPEGEKKLVKKGGTAYVLTLPGIKIHTTKCPSSQQSVQRGRRGPPRLGRRAHLGFSVDTGQTTVSPLGGWRNESKERTTGAGGRGRKRGIRSYQKPRTLTIGSAKGPVEQRGRLPEMSTLRWTRRGRKKSSGGRLRKGGRTGLLYVATQ